MKATILLTFLSLFSACAAGPELKNKELSAAQVEAAKETVTTTTPTRRSLIDYALQIRPDHRAKDYSMTQPAGTSGYAIAAGPYDGWKLEFFLFTAATRDLVIMQKSGPEGYSEKSRPYGLEFEAYKFENNQKQMIGLSEVMPLKKMNYHFDQQIKRLKTNEKFKSGNYIFRYLKLPEVGTTIELKVCSLDRQDENGKYIALGVKGPCLHIGNLNWIKEEFKFTLDKTATLRSSTEKLEKYD